jgi:MFS family permease
MLQAVRPVTQVLAGVVCLETALGILSPTIALQLAHRAEPPEIIGFIGSAYFVGFLIGTMTCHRVIDRVGHIRTFAVFAAVAANATLLYLVFDDIYIWVALRVVTGYAIAGQFVVVESWLNDKATNLNRGRIFSLYMAVSWAASGVSPLALNLADPTGHRLFTLAALALVTSLVPMGLTSFGNPEIGERVHFGIAKLFKISPLGVVACFGSGMATPALYALLPSYMVSAGYTTQQLSIVYSFSTIAGLLAQFPVGYLSDRLGRRPLMLVASLGAAATAFALYATGGSSFAALWPRRGSGNRLHRQEGFRRSLQRPALRLGRGLQHWPVGRRHHRRTPGAWRSVHLPGRLDGAHGPVRRLAHLDPPGQIGTRPVEFRRRAADPGNLRRP